MATNTTKIPVRTTLPSAPALTTLPTIQTNRLLLRPFAPTDLEALHALRRLPEFMAESTLGKADTDISETQTALDDLLRGPHCMLGIFLLETGELIGDGGVHTVRGSALGWPEIGYKLHPARWGCGYATEALAGFLDAWWALPREEAEIMVHPGTLGEGGEMVVVREHVVAEIAAYNGGSRRVLEKLGFKHAGSWEEPDTQLHRLGQPLMMDHYALSSPS